MGTNGWSNGKYVIDLSQTSPLPDVSFGRLDPDSTWWRTTILETWIFGDVGRANHLQIGSTWHNKTPPTTTDGKVECIDSELQLSLHISAIGSLWKLRRTSFPTSWRLVQVCELLQSTTRFNTCYINNVYIMFTLAGPCEYGRVHYSQRPAIGRGELSQPPCNITGMLTKGTATIPKWLCFSHF